jgi:hypothetical protein
MAETKNVFISHVHKDDHCLQKLKDLLAPPALPSKPTKHNTCEQTHQSFQNECEQSHQSGVSKPNKVGMDGIKSDV